LRIAVTAVLARRRGAGNLVAVAATVAVRAVATVLISVVAIRRTSTTVHARVGGLAFGLRERLGTVDAKMARGAAAVELVGVTQTLAGAARISETSSVSSGVGRAISTILVDTSSFAVQVNRIEAETLRTFLANTITLPGERIGVGITIRASGIMAKIATEIRSTCTRARGSRTSSTVLTSDSGAAFDGS